MTTVRIELGIAATNAIQQVRIHNKQIEDVLQAGIERGLTELLSDENLETIIAEATKKEVMSFVSKDVLGWSFRGRVQKHLSEALDEKVNEVAQNIANKIAGGLLKQ